MNLRAIMYLRSIMILRALMNLCSIESLRAMLVLSGALFLVMGNGAIAFAQTKDAKDYPSVQIAGLRWMQENLSVTHYRNGDPIPDGTADAAAWSALERGAFAYPDSNTSSPALWGKLYNGYAVQDPRGLCPTGWRLPTHEEWSALTQALGGEKEAGALLKARQGWFPGWEGRDEKDFRGLPAGFRGGDGTYGGLGAYAYWWSSTPSGINGLWARFVDGRQPGLFMMDGFRRSAFAVRCVAKP